MSKKNDDFFKAKKAWSTVKDDLFACYFKPYVTKILATHKPLIYVDCFAGKGKFDDNTDGSPLIALNIINECILTSRMDSKSIDMYFIELNYDSDLRQNLPQNNPNINIISGEYENNIENILRPMNGCNVFLYIDPYGIKALQHSLFRELSRYRFNSIELLINLNSFGFIREACHALGNPYDIDPDFFNDLVEYEPTVLNTSEKSIDELNEIAGGDYWKDIIRDYKARKYDGYEAESLFALQYCETLRKSYKHVLNMPLRIQQGQRPKYRMVHATNHPDGCVLMADNICKRWEALQNTSFRAQQGLWNEDFDSNIVDDDRIKNNIFEILPTYTYNTPINTFLADFYTKYGAYCKSNDVLNVIKTLEYSKVYITRIPEKTATGKRSKFMTSGDGRAVYIRSIQ
jgi:three-Cys-motif partner protein